MCRQTYKFLLFLGLIWTIGIQPCELYAKTQDSSRTVTYILIDGLSSELFKEALHKNLVPCLAQLLEKSTYTSEGLVSFPSVTGYAYYPFITGRKAHESGILGLRWFDRSRTIGAFRNYVGRTHKAMNYDITDRIQTIFELCASSYSSSINAILCKGAHHQKNTGIAHAGAKFNNVQFFKGLKKMPFIGKKLAYDHYLHESLVTFHALEELKLNPKVQWITYPGLDAYNHTNGIDSNYFTLLTHIDHQICQLLDYAKILNQDSQRAFIIISDHGIESVKHNLDVPQILQKSLGLKVKTNKAVNLFSQRLDETYPEINEYDIYQCINGNLSAYLYFKFKDWRQKLYLEDIQLHYPGLIDTFRRIEGIEFVLLADTSKNLHIFDAHNHVMISYQNNTYAYNIIQGKDILDIHGPTVQDLATSKSAHDWHIHTKNSRYPGAIPLLYDVCTSSTAGDITITSSEGWDLGADFEPFIGNYKGGHGGVRRTNLIVPFILYFPNKKAEKPEVMRSDEVGQMTIKWLLDTDNTPHE